ncbi:LDH2 family malate/lactate/ureidoglycolate dehydrogenase [Shinella sp. BE166]|uniref:Ldh family oxidoreductase n=1 Tax=Shinella sp. BE166 TaxID=3373918 RepID=UPI003EB921A4
MSTLGVESALLVSHDRLAALAAGILAASGMGDGDAATAANLIVEADLCGADAHGVFRLPDYSALLRKGLINPRPLVTSDIRGPAVALVDGDGGIGHLSALRAAELAGELALTAGVAWVGVRRSNHAGATAIYAEHIARKGLVGICASVAAANHMAPWGGAEPLLGTNPLAIAVPSAGQAPFVLDFATSVAAFGAVKTLAMAGQSLPGGWVLDRMTGETLTDPTKLSQGTLAPIAGHKGSGLALAIGLLAGVMSGAAFGRDIRPFDQPADAPADVGHMVIAVDPGRFMQRAQFEAEIARHLDSFAESTPTLGASAVRWPGARRAAICAKRSKGGIPLDRSVAKRLADLAHQLDCPIPFSL